MKTMKKPLHCPEAANVCICHSNICQVWEKLPIKLSPSAIQPALQPFTPRKLLFITTMEKLVLLVSKSIYHEAMQRLATAALSPLKLLHVLIHIQTEIATMNVWYQSFGIEFTSTSQSVLYSSSLEEIEAIKEAKLSFIHHLNAAMHMEAC
ncbi:hypothetical protein Dimus_001849 [Dionaea muscipula]